VSGLPLRPDTYSVNVLIGSYFAIHDFVERAMTFEVTPVDLFGTGRLPERNHGALIADYQWRATESALTTS
jgi:hypothetical protein